MTFAFSPNCLKQLHKIKKTNSTLFKKIQKQISLFEEDIDHPSLRLHKLSGSQQQCWSLSIDRSYRLLFYFQSADDGTKSIVFFNFGTHDDVYS